MKKRTVFLVITLLLVSALAFYGCGGSGSGSSGHVITGVLDTTFGNGGIAVHDNAAGGTAGDDRGNSIALDNNGNIYITGFSHNGSDYDMVIWKYTPAGILDTTFNTNGYVVNHSAAGGSGVDSGNSIAIDNNGYIYVTGYSHNSSGNEDMVIWKYKSNGSRDTTFGTDGYVIHPSAAGGTGVDRGNSIALDNSGNIYVTGNSWNGGNDDMVIWKYTPEGILDTTFDTDGYVVHPSAAGGTGGDRGNSIALDNNGNIYITGYSHNGGDNDMVIWKYTPEGILDSTFDSDGIVVHDNAAGGSFSDYGDSIALDNSGNIYVTGHSTNGSGNYDMIIWKYTSEGILDTTFNDPDGFIVHDNAAGGSGYDTGNSIILDISGNLYVTGVSANSSSNYDMIIWKYTPEGFLDTSFNGTGIVIHDSAAGGSGNDWGYSIALNNGDNLYVTGFSVNSSGNPDMVIWNYK